MQKESVINNYWEKDNFLKPKQRKTKSTISQSVKGICTNIWYKLGGQSILSKKNTSNFDSITMLGKKYSSYELAQRDFKSLFWFTYRKEIKINGVIMSDLGWGCLIRVGQMLLANCLKRYFQQTKSHASQQNILIAFLDDYEGVRGNYSLQRILQKGSQKFQLKAGEWFNISQICYLLMSLQNNIPMKGSQELKMIYFNQTLIFLDEKFADVNREKFVASCVMGKQVIARESGSFQLDFEILDFDDIDMNSSWEKQSQKSTPRRSNLSQEENCEKQSQETEKYQQIRFHLLLVVSTRISQNNIDQQSYEAILDLISLPTSMGVIGGVPHKGLYFVGSCDQNLIYLDPHLVQNPVNTFNLSKQLHSFHCQNLRLIGRNKLDPSIGLAFYIKSLSQLDQLIDRIQIIKKKNPDVVPVSYMWENEFSGENDNPKVNEVEMEDQSPDFSFIV